MDIRFSIKYRTEYGEEIQMRFFKAQDCSDFTTLPMRYEADDLWVLDTDQKELGTKEINYQYALIRTDKSIEKLENIFFLHLKNFKTENLEVNNEWVNENGMDALLQTRPFVKLLGDKSSSKQKHIPKNTTHCIYLHTNEMDGRFIPCLIGEGKKLNDWSEIDPLFFSRSFSNWALNLNIGKEHYELAYKIALYDQELKKIVEYETGPNRIFKSPVKDTLQLEAIVQYFPDQTWRAAGINVQLSSLKTRRSWGVGDFTDLFLLSDLAQNAGMKLIQLLPVNDTTATHTVLDSYPYSAISAFALHPVFLNVQKMATASSVLISPEMYAKVEQLNNAQTFEYEKVSKLKYKVLQRVYEAEKQFFKDDLDWFEFFDINRDWLQPYAAFCFLRDKYETADFSKWEKYSVYDESLVLELVEKDSKNYEAVAFHYFIQYHLHLQLSEAADYAHRKGIVLKADLPIGVGRHSVDTWMHSPLFHMDMQAGAPPDAFAIKGQNWSFPTYNWEAMEKNNYAWWRQRMEQLSNYFDAVRIDHVLGFFRIWSIPMTAVEGILGRFYPAVSLSADEIKNTGIYFSEERFCAPYITEEILYHYFGDKAGEIKELFFNNGCFKSEFDTQQKLAVFMEVNPAYEWCCQGLMDLHSNIIFIKDEVPGQYHFRINIFETLSFQHLPENEKQKLDKLYVHYFFHLQNQLWEKEGIKKLEALRLASDNMLLCGEDLGMVPEFVPAVLHHMQILSLQVERMPKKNTESFSQPQYSPYDAVVTPSTHDMSTIREWWEEDRELTQRFYNGPLGYSGYAPFYCEDWICKQIIAQHLYSPAMWTIFLMQDLLGTDANLRRQNPKEERINIPADPTHVWNYRMHCSIEELLEADEFTSSLKQLVQESGRVAE